MSKRESIVSLMRGYYAVPVISSLGRFGVLDLLVENDAVPFDRIEEKMNRRTARFVVTYLARIDLLTLSRSGEVSCTDLGRSVFKRWGGFAIMHSYHPYMSSIDQLLFEKDFDRTKEGISVDRAVNILGSGQLHSKKFFGVGLDWLEGPVNRIVDVGCGDGLFLTMAGAKFPDAKLTGVDYSEIALKKSAKRVADALDGRRIDTALHDARYLDTEVPKMDIDEEDGVVFSFWFLLHEVCDGSTERMLSIFRAIVDRFPGCSILIGEIFEADADKMAEVSPAFISPEFLFFHDLSGQVAFRAKDFLDQTKAAGFAVKRKMITAQTEDGTPLQGFFLLGEQ